MLINQMPNQTALSKWREAANKEGYLVKGNFKPLPKKGTAEYDKIMVRYKAM